MISITNKQNCCGCGACAQACSLNCITMTADAEGFLYPKVDAVRCVNCGACTRACPILNRGDKPAQIQVYAAYSKEDAVRQNSSSGGVFTLLAETVLSDGGAVFGAAFDSDWSVHHVMIDHAEQLHLLKGSKYLQSRIEDTYRQAERLLKEGHPVLFSGTGCQIAGLKAYLKKDYEHLYTVDVFCHGVPSPMIWQKYLQEKEKQYGSTVDEVSFRHKSNGWHDFSMYLRFDNDETSDVIHCEDGFMRVFLDNICLRPSCYDCKFRESRSGADLTIGDAWGIEQWMPDMDDNKGTSVIVVNTTKGQKMLDGVSDRLRMREGDAQEILSCNSMYYQSVKVHPNRKKFFSAYHEGATMKELVRICRKPLWRRGLSFAKRCVKKVLTICGIRI